MLTFHFSYTNTRALSKHSTSKVRATTECAECINHSHDAGSRATGCAHSDNTTAKHAPHSAHSMCVSMTIEHRFHLARKLRVNERRILRWTSTVKSIFQSSRPWPMKWHLFNTHCHCVLHSCHCVLHSCHCVTQLSL